ncbi:hypothetical protein [Shewanella aestuarii]|uniref:DUF2913 family protein n=1 Tax=Shewanella aestuarii TaxID=1028752 RepID=A0A6G9QQ07_9GAMM|nr:hypothetical protein [Shewanella aestuarii]QIR16646.1 hypothetical protein HBH39_19425 [Shewanella aestuarii]
MQDKYKSVISGFCRHNLISLYLHVAECGRHVPTKNRNAFLLKRFKDQYKLPINKPIKKEIKALIVKSSAIDLEKQLIALNSLVEDNEMLINAEEKWYEYLYQLQEDTGFKVESYNNQLMNEHEDAVFVIKDEIFENFQRNKTPGPMTLFIKTQTRDAEINEWLEKNCTALSIKSKERNANQTVVKLDFSDDKPTSLQ